MPSGPAISSNFRTYYFYEFGKDDLHLAVMAGVRGGKVCYYAFY